ncbi:unnamed protein product [Diamesa tonsa]
MYKSDNNNFDNRKPQFKNCKGYAPVLKEEQPHRTFVVKVEATDPDKQDRIEYSFVTAASERSKFSINPSTGVIQTAHIFDRDEPAREKEAYITVRATDNGRPPLDDVCTFKVNIEDINDNPPVFDKTKYEELMPEDLLVNKIVARISATDLDDGNNSFVMYEVLESRDYKYFRIDNTSGVISLNRHIDKKPGQFYVINVRAFNTVPDPVQTAEIEIRIRIIESNKRPPVFIDPPTEPIVLRENHNEFSKALMTLTALSNVPDKPELIFELVTGRTEQTNSKKTFVFNQQDKIATISLGKSLDFEAITDYTLTMTVKNSYDLIAEHIVKIRVEDVNDNIPYFTEVTTGTIPENEPPGTPVMQVRAFDMDGTMANNIVTFELADNKEFFEIDPHTGNITALTSFDREERDFYNVKILATDNSPSSLYNTGKPNLGQQVFRIEIADKNDHPPKFKQDEYIAEKLPEDANLNALVIEVTAFDEDTASQIDYTIESGNVDDAFKIESSTGKITVNKKLDYETITEYTLKIRAFDGIYSDHAKVSIRIENVNDNPPVFQEEEYQAVIDEEQLQEGCILNIEAYDPDIKDRNLPQHIRYYITKKDQRDLLAIDEYGCLKLIKPLDRDKPNGHKTWQILIQAIDENGQGLTATKAVIITLNDINDNAPFLDMVMPIVWNENRPPGKIVTLQANDYDELITNGFRYDYEIDQNATNDIKNKFTIDGDSLSAIVEFDREQQKEYFIPILVSDTGSPVMKNVSILHLVIGDVNDNPMEAGESNIFVYNYKGEAPNTEVGRVYVKDPDDWDLPDKTFHWKDGIQHSDFSLNEESGMITMIEGIKENSYLLNFAVTEESGYITRHEVYAVVNVTVRYIPEEAVDKSGSIRFYGITAEEFIDEKPNMLSPKQKLQNALSVLFNTSRDNVDIFTVLKNELDLSILDVRFSAHGSPYYEPEKMNGKIAQFQHKLENELGLKMQMINIDECLIERSKCELSCYNVLEKSNVPLSVFTNQTSFVGVNAFVRAECGCREPNHGPIVCLNGGTAFDNYCECHSGFEGPHCEQLSIGFYGDGYALYPPISPCESTKINLELKPQTKDGLVMYIGPMSYNSRLPVQDFFALELINGYPILTIDYGTGSTRIEHNHIQLQPGNRYFIEILLQRSNIEMTVDHCILSTCISLGAPVGKNEFLNVNSPIQLGGANVDLDYLAEQFNWTHKPRNRGYSGCIKNLTINSETYNLGQPSLQHHVDPGCGLTHVEAVTFGLTSNFLIAIIACIILLLILILAVVVHKKSYDGWHEKDMDDIRETIINYEDEGGGERDTDYDLNVLRGPPIYEDKPYKDLRQREANEVPDIGAFLIDKKDACDKDTDAYPIDDVRHYAYEGDGNSSGSLSSLASCTDDGDLKFNYLSNFGPRFRKLADMYGETPSDDDCSNGDADEGWRI